MRNKLASGGFVVAVTAIAVIAIMASCAKKIVNSPHIGVPIVISAKAFEAASPAQRPDSFMLTVDAKDIANRIVVPLTLQDGYLTGQAVIPAGQARHFVVTALLKGVVMYRGEMTADVYPGVQLELSVEMHPMVPMLNITPHIQQVTMDSTFAVDINAFNLPKLELMSIRFACNSSIKGFKVPVWVDSVTQGKGVDPGKTRFSYHLGYTGTMDTAVITIGSVGNVSQPFLDSTGNGQLATVYLRTSSNYPFDTVAALLNIPEGYLQFFGDSTRASWTDTIGISDSIHTDDAIVSLVRAAINPSAPRLELKPRYQEIMMTSPFVLDLNIYNEPNLQSIYLNLSYTNMDSSYSTSPPMHLDSVGKGSGVDSAAYLYYYRNYRTIQISIDRGEVSVPGTSILGPSGSGQLAKLYFSSHSDYSPDAAWVSFQFDTGWLYFPDNVTDSLPNGTVKINRAYTYFWKGTRGF